MQTCPPLAAARNDNSHRSSPPNHSQVLGHPTCCFPPCLFAWINDDRALLHTHIYGDTSLRAAQCRPIQTLSQPIQLGWSGPAPSHNPYNGCTVYNGAVCPLPSAIIRCALYGRAAEEGLDGIKQSGWQLDMAQHLCFGGSGGSLWNTSHKLL